MTGVPPSPVRGGAELLVVDLGQELALFHEVAALDVDLADIARDLGEDGRLLVRQDVRSEGELDLDVAPLGRYDPDHGIGPAARDGARRPRAGPIPHRTAEADEEEAQDKGDTVALRKSIEAREAAGKGHRLSRCPYSMDGRQRVKLAILLC